MKIGIIGTGLIGGSLGMALKASRKHKISCWNRREEVSKKAIKLKAADKYFDSMEELAADSDIIIICTPISSYSLILKKISKRLKAGTIISDVGSVKKEVDKKELLKVLPQKLRMNFVPAHPIAGKEQGGLENAAATLYKGKKLIITKPSNCKKAKKIASVWKDAGAKIEFMSAKKHDEIYAYVSHYIQYLSFLLKDYLKNEKGEFLRLSNSPRDFWNEIFEYNNINLEEVNLEFTKHLKSSLGKLEKNSKKELYMYLSEVIAKNYDEIVPKEYKKYAGSGYKSFTSPLLKANNKPAKTNASEGIKILKWIINGLEKAKF